MNLAFLRQILEHYRHLRDRFGMESLTMRELADRLERPNGPKRIVLLAVDCPSTRYVYHALQPAFPVAGVVLENPVPRARLLRNRVKKLGLARVAGQVLFQAFAVPLLRAASRRRAAEIRAGYGLDGRPIEDAVVVRVPSVNSDEAERVLRSLSPDVVVVNGTRIISPRTLDCVPARFVNLHTGITPVYRGVHGAYWALAEGDRQGWGDGPPRGSRH